MKLRKYWHPLLLSVLLSNGAQAQEQFINQSLAPDPIEESILAVYGEDWVSKNQDAVDALDKCIRERITYVQLPLTAEDKYPLLSSFPLMNKNNPAIVAIDYLSFNPDTFMPLTYNLPFFSDMKQAIRVDGTNYVIVIEPQNKN